MVEILQDKHVKSVHVVSTGSAAQHPEHRFGSKKPALWWIFTSRKWVDIPINVFVIEHKDGLVLFDTGLDIAVQEDPQYVSGAIERFFMRHLFQLRMTNRDKLSTKLGEIGFDIQDVEKAVISHLHFDHVGGIAELPQAKLLVSQTEWALLDGPHPERDFILKEHIDIPHAKWQKIKFEPSVDPLFSDFEGIYDVMGDGALILLPTPGHTPGSISMLVRGEDHAPLLFVGDLSYDGEQWEIDKIPGTGDKDRLLASYTKLKKLKKQLPDLVVLAAHDPNAPEKLRTARKPH